MVQLELYKERTSGEFDYLQFAYGKIHQQIKGKKLEWSDWYVICARTLKMNKQEARQFLKSLQNRFSIEVTNMSIEFLEVN